MDTYRFVCVGREGWGQSFAELLGEYGLEEYAVTGRITHLGYISEEQKNALMLSAAGLIYPSLFEGFGLPVLEGMALGVPVASSCSTSLPEVLGPEGVYFDPYSIDSFNIAMKTLIGENLTGQYGTRSAALKVRAAEFTYDRCFEVIMASLKKNYFHSENSKPQKVRKKSSGVRKLAATKT